MKKFFKYSFLFILIFIVCSGVIFRNKISFLYNLSTTYLELYSSKDLKTINLEPIQNATYKDITYKSRNGKDLKLDLYSAINKKYKKSPVILYVHGGGWIYGDKTIPEFLSPLLQVFREEGFTIISTSYELLNPSISFDEQVCDVKDTLRWLDKNKDEYNLDIDQVGVIGVSSGAHLSLLATYSNNDEFTGDKNLEGYNTNVKYIIDLFGPTNLFTLDIKQATWDMKQVLKGISNKGEYFNKYSPLNYLREGLPNILIVHSKSDEVVPYENATLLYEGNLAFNNNATLVPLTLSSHEMNNISTDEFKECMFSLLKFLIRNTPI